MPSAPHLGGGLRSNLLAMLDRIENFEREVIAARGKFADRRANQVVSNNSGNSGSQSGSRRDQSLRNTGSHSSQRRRTSSPESVKRINDSPHRPEQPHKRRHGRSNREPGHIALEPCDFFGSSNLHSALDRRQIPQ